MIVPSQQALPVLWSLAVVAEEQTPPIAARKAPLAVLLATPENLDTAYSQSASFIEAGLSVDFLPISVS